MKNEKSLKKKILSLVFSITIIAVAMNAAVHLMIRFMLPGFFDNNVIHTVGFVIILVPIIFIYISHELKKSDISVIDIRNSELEKEIGESEERYRVLIENSPAGILTCDTQGNITMVNLAVVKILGSPSVEATKQTNVFTYPPLIECGIAGSLKKCLETGQVFKGEFAYTSKWGKDIYLKMHFAPICELSGKITGLQGIIEDFTEYKKAQDQLRLYFHVIEHSPVAVNISNKNGDIEYINPKYTELTGYTPDDVVGKNTSLMYEKNKATEMYFKELIETIKAGKVWKREFHNTKKNGERYWENIMAAPVLDETGGIAYLIAIKEDITERVEESRKANYLAYHDLITHLPNYYGMKNYVNSRIDKEINSAVFVLIYVRGLKTINALNGYERGNELLKEIGQFLLCHNKTYYCSRTGSNEFGLFIESRTDEGFFTAIDDLKEALNKFIQNKGYGITTNFRFALSVYPEHGNNFEALYEKATLVMKLIKDSAERHSGIYQDQMKMEMEEKIQLCKELTEAIQNHEIIPYYQAKTDYTNGKVVGVEALARWRSDKRGLVSPGLFIPLIVEMNLTDDFTYYMIYAALKQYNDLCRKYGDDIDLSINVTPSSFLSSNLFDRINQALADFSIPLGKLVLEITEDVFVSDTETIQKITRDLHQIGVRTAIDDFGTGYSSLNSLVKIEFDELKIDKSFIDKILIDEKAFQLVVILCQIASLYDYEIVAEGVESVEQLERLKGTGLKIIQGYLFSKPEPL